MIRGAAARPIHPHTPEEADIIQARGKFERGKFRIIKCSVSSDVKVYEQQWLFQLDVESNLEATRVPFLHDKRDKVLLSKDRNNTRE